MAVLKRRSIIDKIRSPDIMPGIAENAHNGPGAASRLPDGVWEFFRTQERGDRLWRRLIKIVLPLVKRRGLVAGS
jgi:hypothetical protein